METRELIVEGTPRSLQGSPHGIARWKRAVVDAAYARFDDETYSIQHVDVAVAVLHFCRDWGAMGDLDNIAKPILDALCESSRVLFNDNQVKELLLRRVEWRHEGRARIDDATPLLAERVERALRGDDEGDFVYIRVTTSLWMEKLR